MATTKKSTADQVKAAMAKVEAAKAAEAAKADTKKAAEILMLALKQQTVMLRTAQEGESHGKDMQVASRNWVQSLDDNPPERG